MGAEFAKCVTTGTGGDIEIVTHPSGSLFPGAQIKRAIQTGQVPIGERLLSGHQNENAVFGFDSIPFLATSFEDASKLWKAAKGGPYIALSSINSLDFVATDDRPRYRIHPCQLRTENE